MNLLVNQSVLQNNILPSEAKGNFSVNIKSELTPEKIDIIKKIHFLICGSCFWCASYYDTSNLNKVINARAVTTTALNLYQFLTTKATTLAMTQDVE